MPRKKQDSTDTSTKSTPTSKRQYKSIFKEGYVTAGNYITEVIFEKRHNHFNCGRFPEKFWTDKKHQGPYKGQVIQANRLLKKYHPDSIIKAIKSPEAKFIFKLQDKKLIPIIEKIESRRVETEIEYSKPQESGTPMPSFSKHKNILRDL